MKKKRIKNVIIIISIVLIGFVGMSVLSSSDSESQKRDVKPQIRAVKTELINFGDLNLEITGNGIVESKSILEVVSEVSGIVEYAKNNLKNGTHVESGEVVVKVDSREIENNLFSLRSDFINSLAQLLPDLKVESEDLYNKWSELFSSVDIHKNIPPLPETSNLQEKIKLSTRQIFSKYYAVRNQEILLSKYVIKAPFDGYIKSSGIIENSFISRGQDLFKIEDVFNLEIAVPLLVDEFNQIKSKDRTFVEISSDNSERILNAKLVRTDPVLDRNSQSLNVYVAFQNPKMIPEFLSGNYVNVKIVGKKIKDVAAIPRHLVDNENYVFTIENGKLAREKVEIVAVQKEKMIVANTFDNDLEIVTTILQKPLIGMPIKSINHTAEIDTTSLYDDSVAVK